MDIYRNILVFLRDYQSSLVILFDLPILISELSAQPPNILLF